MVRAGAVRKVAEDKAKYQAMTPETAMKKIKQLEERMYRHARNLEFEEAARIRDEIKHIRETAFELPEREAG
jgi:excinuclease ABC subunit B